MKQLLKNLRDGKTLIGEVPIPMVLPGTALVQTRSSLVSAGTERMVVEFAEKNLLGKARLRPDLVSQAIDKMRREGLQTTLESIFNRLDQPMALGYSSAGTIVEIGPGLVDFQAGDRVACAGSSAAHAEYVVVPQNLMVHLPSEVDFDSAAFTTLGAIALHGFRLGQIQFGERVAVIGLGLLGLLTVGIANAAGCNVMGIDIDSQRVALGSRFGAVTALRENAESITSTFTNGIGFDAVLICADTRSNDPIDLAGKITRDRGRVVAVGAVGLSIPRKPYYEKEIQFMVSRSYGPGRYDPQYEQQGIDYPIGYVRWTENRNMQAFIELLAERSPNRPRLDVNPLISHRIPIENGIEAYELITGKAKKPFLGVVITYHGNEANTVIKEKKTIIHSTHLADHSYGIKLGVLGAGNFASGVFLPNAKKTGRVTYTGIASSTGLSAAHTARRYDFSFATSDENEILNHPDINLVVILDRHQHHARQSLKALTLGKNVFCEKPLAIKTSELQEIAAFLNQNPATNLLTVGFNRRFAPYAIQMKQFLQNSGEPMIAHYRINAGYLPLSHWLHDPLQGGGRIIGEACHFIDFLTYLTGLPPQALTVQSLPDLSRYHQDNFILTFNFADGSVGSITYLANGDKSVPKERLEVFSAGRIAILDDFRTLELVKQGNKKVYRSLLKQDKGHQNLWKVFLDSIEQNQQPPIAYQELLQVSQAAITASEAVQNHLTGLIKIPDVINPGIFSSTPSNE